MNVKHGFKDDILIITPEFEHLDTQNAGDFKDEVIDLVSSYGSPKVVFDLHRIKSVDSYGLGTILSILKSLHLQGGDLKLARLNHSAKETMEFVSLHKILEIFSGNEAAIHSFKP